MSDVSSGARAPDGSYAEPVYPATTGTAGPVSAAYPAGTVPAGTMPATSGDDSTAKQVVGQTKQAAGQAAADVKDTAKEQAQRVGTEAKTQARNIASDLRDRVGQQARTQNSKLVDSIRLTADQLEEMRGSKDSPAANAVSRIADGGRQLADYLDRHGPEGVLSEVQDFARRRPGAFLATALAAGFVVGRLGKGVAKADDAGKPGTDSYVSGIPERTAGYGPGAGYPATGTGYAAGTGYVTEPGYVENTQGYPTSTEYASTGTGTAIPVEEEYVAQNPSATRDYPGGGLR